MLNRHDIGDISAVAVHTFDGFYNVLEQMACYTFLSSSFTIEQMKDIARDRMITDAGDMASLIEKISRVG